MKVELKNIHKHFGPIPANDGVTLTVEPGTLHGLLGENGAGKSTLMKVLSGFLSPDRGEILLDGKTVRFHSPAEAVALGVGMLHQDPLDFPALRVIDNFLLGSPREFLLDRKHHKDRLNELADRFGFKLDPEARVSDLSIGERQQLEIIRLLALGVSVLILDEPTTAISAQQRENLFNALNRLTGEGKTILFVSHKLDEVKGLCGKVTVLAHGKVAGEAAADCPTEELVKMMFGQAFTIGKRCEVTLGEPIFELQDITLSDWRLEVKGLSLKVREGEVVGLTGLEGSGQQMVLRGCAGLLKPSVGRIWIDHQDLTGRPYQDFIEAGVGYMPAGRLEEGLIAGMTLAEHMALIETNPAFFIDWNRAGEKASQRIREFNIKGQPTTLVEGLSGGNQQRTLLSLLPPQPKLLLMEHPTRGLDMESVEYIWRLLQARTREGTAILFISSDPEELLDRSDRILIFFGGKVKVMDACGASLFQLGESIGGKGFG
ncbi:MAG: ATP-binding cassette domain-containing protein [Deltaproteobacteria bacterium]|nr:ATP-binding cassette domain-containing protein [Deltaproteobacteria bacterium]